MSRYLLIESEGPTGRIAGDAARLAETGAQVVLLLIENGVAGAVRGAVPEVEAFARHGGSLWVDDFSLGQRALVPADLVERAEVVTMDTVAEAMLRPDVRAVWH